jgi:hypothetical protein
MSKHRNKKSSMFYTVIDSQNVNLRINKDIFKGKKKNYAVWELNYRKCRTYVYAKFQVKM